MAKSTDLILKAVQETRALHMGQILDNLIAHCRKAYGAPEPSAEDRTTLKESLEAALADFHVEPYR